MPHSLTLLRHTIDTIDMDLVILLGKRFEIVREIGALKKEIAMAPAQPDRWQEVLTHVTDLAELNNVPKEFILELYELIHEYSLREEEK